jgi:hypothetical protein
MLGKLRSKLTYANVTATLALFVALGGTGAYAANEWTGANIQDGSLAGVDIADGSVASRDVQDNSVRGEDIADGLVASRDVQNNSLRGEDIADGLVASRDVQDGSLRGDDINDNTLTGADINDNSLTGADINESTLAPVPAAIADNSVTSAKVANGSLNDEDVGQGTFVNFEANIGTVPAHDCVDRQVTGVNARLDHVLLTPDWNNADPELVYSVLYSSQSGTDEGFVMIRVCNPTAVAGSDGNTRFNLLVIDAQ